MCSSICIDSIPSNDIPVTDGTVYRIEKCIHHLRKKKNDSLPMPAWKLLRHEVAELTEEEIEGSIRGRSRPFHKAVRDFRGDNEQVDLHCSPFALYIGSSGIRVEIARAECFCRHVFHVQKEEFYDIIGTSKVHSMDIQIEEGGKELFDFIAFTLPGVWCRELKALNIVFGEKVHWEPLSTFLKKSRGLSRLRIAHKMKALLRVSDIIKNMGCLEELELNCPDNNVSGYLLDKETLHFIVEQDKRTGAQKPFRKLKAFNTFFDFSSRHVTRLCTALSKMDHNQLYTEFETINEMRGRGQIDLDAEGSAITFDITPKISKEYADRLFKKICKASKSYIFNFDSTKPTQRYFLMRNTLFRITDSD